MEEVNSADAKGGTESSHLHSKKRRERDEMTKVKKIWNFAKNILIVEILFF